MANTDNDEKLQELFFKLAIENDIENKLDDYILKFKDLYSSEDFRPLYSNLFSTDCGGMVLRFSRLQI